ncbi:uncharacterized protein LOC124269900 [Haliotis rubra]|uniref:uncharacterized protein LOC124269900 n=1 Tax=Haliotis rubra TaxID=36100 RepID=UPI001EE4EEC8|nr:uncharacterized protein LOC124269900 [Haliotis rubra]
MESRILLLVVLTIGCLGEVDGIWCYRCVSLTKPSCTAGTGLLLINCPAHIEHCSTYVSFARDNTDHLVVRDCGVAEINRCTTKVVDNHDTISCFRSCDQDGCNGYPLQGTHSYNRPISETVV